MLPSLCESKSVLPSMITKKEKSVIVFKVASPRIFPAAAKHAEIWGRIKAGFRSM